MEAFVFTFVLILVTVVHTGSSLKIEVFQNGSRILPTYSDESAEYNDKSINIPQTPLVGQLVYPVPRNACSTLESNGTDLFAFIEEYGLCPRQAEINVLVAGYTMMIATTLTAGGLDDFTELPKALVSHEFAEELKKYAISNISFSNASTVYLSVSEAGFRLYERLFIIFGSILLAAVIIAVLIFCCSLCCRTVVVKWRTRGLSQWRVRQLPKRKYKCGETCETCSICLEDFKEGEPVRVLPCEHVFHPSCVDEWLRKWNRTCPLCKSAIRRRGAVRDASTSEQAQLIPNEEQQTETTDGESYGATGYSTNPLTDTEMDNRSNGSSNESEGDPREQRGGSRSLRAVATLELSSPPSRATTRSPEAAHSLEDVDLGPEITTIPGASGNNIAHV